MLRANRKFRLHRDFRGKITVGNRGKNAKDHPKALDHFNLIDFPELTEIYGKKPTEMYIILLSDNIEDFYQDGYSRWGKKGETAFLIRKCDGETSYNPIEESFEPCHKCYSDECPLNDKDRCRPFGFLRALITTIPDPEKGIPPIVVNMAPYQFEWHSENSGDNIYSELHKTWQMTGGRLFGVPMKITVKMNEELKKNDKGETYKKKYPLIYLEQVGSIDKVIQIAKAKVLPTLPENTELYKQLSPGEPVKALVEGNGQEQQPKPKAGKHISVLDELKSLFSEVSKNAEDQKSFRAKIAQQVFQVKTWAEVKKLDRERLTAGRDVLQQFLDWGNKQTEKITEQQALDKLDEIIQQAAFESENQTANPKELF
jgi:hypothetical protein